MRNAIASPLPAADPSPTQAAERRSWLRFLSPAYLLRLGSSLRPRGWRLTAEGKLWLLVLVLMLGIGIFKNINLLALLGYTLLALLVLNVLVVARRLGRLQARRHIGELIFAGAGCPIEVRLYNRSGRPRSGVRLEDSGPDHSLSWYLDHLEGHARRACRGEIVLPRRGWYDWGPIVVSSGYPFGLVSKQVAIAAGVRVRVLPRPGRLRRERLRQQLRGVDPHGERVRRRGWRDEAAQADVHGLRTFRPGDSPRWIHWRTSARRGELMVREMEDVPGDDLVLVLDTESADLEKFEEAVRLAASIVWEWCRRRGDRLMLAVAGPQRSPGAGGILDGTTGPEHALCLLECLAEVQATPARGGCGVPPTPPSDDSVLRELARRAPRTAAVVVVSAGASQLPVVLAASLSRPATLLDVTHWEEWGFYHP
jgi:uncharacterized protein (DUF58 family)